MFCGSGLIVSDQADTTVLFLRRDDILIALTSGPYYLRHGVLSIIRHALVSWLLVRTPLCA